MNRTYDKAHFKHLIKFVLCFTFFCVFLTSFAGCAPGDYKPELKEAQVRTPDILNSGILKVGVDFDNPPMICDSNKSTAGIDADVAAAIADQLGLKVEFVDVGSTPESSLNNKKVDIVMGVSSKSASTDIWKSNPYLQTSSVLFASKPGAAVPNSDSADKMTALLASSSALSAQNQFNVDNIKLESSLNACFESLKKGEATYVIADAVIGAYAARSMDIDAYTIANISKIGGYCIGVLESNNGLKNKITLALEELTKSGICATIEKKWLGKNLDLSILPYTEGSNNQADIQDIENGVYGEVSGTAKQN